mmetsp:Transcript_31451/g.57611  ORF Transcript_31451/g.57611 Transcript_31451/m.57611 type:complete len:1535 (+) Transcript_31451:73-4677(+)
MKLHAAAIGLLSIALSGVNAKQGSLRDQNERVLKRRKGNNNARGTGNARGNVEVATTNVEEAVECSLTTIEPLMLNPEDEGFVKHVCVMNSANEDNIAGIAYEIDVDGFDPGVFEGLRFDGTDRLSISSANVEVKGRHGGGTIKGPTPQGIVTMGKLSRNGAETRKKAKKTVKNRRDLSQKTGTSTLLVLYAIPLDVENGKSSTQYSDDIFGTDGDPVNVRSQASACSRGQLEYVPAESDLFVNGVLEVPIDNNIAGEASGTVVNWVTAAAQELLIGSGVSLFDFTQIMHIIPDEASWGGAAAWAYLPGSVSAFRDSYADRMGVQLHEFGHNLGLHHSGNGDKSYADHSCLMGNPSYGDDGPQICWNAAKSWESTWYADDSVTVTPSASGESIQLVGVADWAESVYTSGTHRVVLEIKDSSVAGLDYYVIYNRAKGPNAGVTFAKDTVTISTGADRKVSWHQAALKAGEHFRKVSYNGGAQDLVVKVCDMTTGSANVTPDTARVLIYLDGGAAADNGPSCEAAEREPSASPVAATPQPTPGPTTQAPITKVPTKGPTTSPVVAKPQPTPEPSTQAPTTKVPTNAPTEAPTEKPTNSPSTSPPTTSAPTKTPTVPPTPPPTSPPSLKPTPIPSEECLHGSFILEIEDACTADSVLEAYSDQVYNAAGAISSSCSSSAESDLNLKLAAAGISDASALCDQVYLTQDKVPFTSAANRGTDMNFEKMFFNGRTDWQEEVETIYETEDYSASSNLKEDAEQVRAFYDGVAQGRRVEWPGTLPNFQSSFQDADGLATCTTNAAMCCWPKDRQANDNNGNCAKAYDENCVDKDPADNTDLCFVDLERGNASTGVDSTGPIVYSGDNNDGEGSIHCHGLAWSNDINDKTARYKANNLFFVSMYDHMYQRGYVKNVPGAPMCGCVEQMPTVSRSDCTQVDLTETITITYDADNKAFDSKLTSVHIEFNACQGIDNRNNDLWAYIARLYYQDDITREQFGEAGRIITNTNCDQANLHQLNKNSLTPGYDHDTDEWTRVAGRDSMHLTDPYGHRAFTRSLVPSTGDPDNTHYGIIYRACQSCVATHMKIFYRRKKPVPDELNLQYQVLYSGSKHTNNVWNVDFSIHSTYEDALNNVNPWECPGNNFDYRYTFYGRCSPDGTGVNNQHSRFHVAGERNDVAYFVNKPEDDGLQIEPTNIIKGREYASGMALKDPTDGTIYMTGAGREIGWVRDDFNYLSEEVDGDHTAIVHVGSISVPQPHAWSKSGIIFRSGLESNAAYYGLFLTGSNGVCFQGRMYVGSYYSHFGCVQAGIKEAWIKVEKQLDMFYSFIGAQETEGGPITWTQIHSREIAAIGEDSYQVGLGVASRMSFAQEVLFKGYEVDAFFFPSMAPTSSQSPTSGSALTELAVASQSCTSYGGVASRAIDGSTKYGWGDGSVTHTCGNSNPWWQVDLGTDNVHINAVSVYNRGDCCQNRFHDTKIQVFDADGALVAEQEFEGIHDVYRFNFGNVVGRTVKINKVKYGVLNIAEVKVNGFAAPDGSRKLRG